MAPTPRPSRAEPFAPRSLKLAVALKSKGSPKNVVPRPLAMSVPDAPTADVIGIWTAADTMSRASSNFFISPPSS